MAHSYLNENGAPLSGGRHRETPMPLFGIPHYPFLIIMSGRISLLSVELSRRDPFGKRFSLCRSVQFFFLPGFQPHLYGEVCCESRTPT